MPDDAPADAPGDAPPQRRDPPLIVVVSGPSGVGKDALLARVTERDERFAVPVTMTTRAPRSDEVDGVDYLFVSNAEFRRRLEASELLEHAQVYGRLYGVPRSQLRSALASGRDVIMRVDVQGAATLRRVLPDAVFVFVMPEDIARLEDRLRERGTEAPTLRRRMDEVERELAQRERFDHVVVNVEGDLDGTASRVLAIVEAERARPGRAAVEV